VNPIVRRPRAERTVAYFYFEESIHRRADFILGVFVCFRDDPSEIIACRVEGREADVWKAVFWHSLVLASLVGLVVLIYAYAAPWVIRDPGSKKVAWARGSR